MTCDGGGTTVLMGEGAEEILCMPPEKAADAELLERRVRVGDDDGARPLTVPGP
jgi:hypothetical protein